ncbi:MAG: L,D-transpeptidase family protein [Bacteroidetes bacterium]|nr:L,D-transpeptidase family protein [Bacteroidota bacterium]
MTTSILLSCCLFLATCLSKPNDKVISAEFDNADYSFLQKRKLKPGILIDSICVIKAKREMVVFANGIIQKIYKIALGYNPEGKKMFEGDGKTPEGLYFINSKNKNSIYHKNLGISYPNTIDRANAAMHHKSPGGDIKIHGWPNCYTEEKAKFLAPDWTIGCIAISNDEIDELFEATETNIPILIKP